MFFFEQNSEAIEGAVKNLSILPGRLIRFTTARDDEDSDGLPLFVADFTENEKRIYLAYLQGPGTDRQIARSADVTSVAVAAARKRKAFASNLKFKNFGKEPRAKGVGATIWGLA